MSKWHPPEYYKAYREKNKERIKQREKEYRSDRKEYIADRDRKYRSKPEVVEKSLKWQENKRIVAKEQMESLTDGYLLSQLRRYTGISRHEIREFIPEAIMLLRVQIKTKRYLKNQSL